MYADRIGSWCDRLAGATASCMSQGRSRRWGALGSTGWHVLEHSSVTAGASPSCPIRVTFLMAHTQRLAFGPCASANTCQWLRSSKSQQHCWAWVLGLHPDPRPGLTDPDTSRAAAAEAPQGKLHAMPAACEETNFEPRPPVATQPRCLVPQAIAGCTSIDNAACPCAVRTRVASGQGRGSASCKAGSDQPAHIIWLRCDSAQPPMPHKCFAMLSLQIAVYVACPACK